MPLGGDLRLRVATGRMWQMFTCDVYRHPSLRFHGFPSLTSASTATTARHLVSSEPRSFLFQLDST